MSKSFNLRSMKKVSFWLMAAAMGVFVACGNGASTETENVETETVEEMEDAGHEGQDHMEEAGEEMMEEVDSAATDMMEKTEEVVEEAAEAVKDASAE